MPERQPHPELRDGEVFLTNGRDGDLHKAGEGGGATESRPKAPGMLEAAGLPTEVDDRMLAMMESRPGGWTPRPRRSSASWRR